MPTPPDHAEWLRRDDYPVPPAAPLTDAERRIVARFGHWMEALTRGTIAPATPDQEHFVLAARGMEDPTSAFEIAWDKARQAAPAAPAPATLFATAKHLEETRAAAIAIRQEDVSRRLDILAKVQPEIDALDAEMSARLKPLEAEIARLEELLKEGVRATGKTYRHRGIRVTYARGRVTFDNKGLQQYALAHPDVNQFRKVGQPIISLRYVSPDDPKPPPATAADGE
jgi:uncharacterized protein YifE (UPF0438 family)